MKICPHIEKCRQLIPEEAFYTCIGELEEYDYDDCLEYADNLTVDPNEILRLPRDWDKELNMSEKDKKFLGIDKPIYPIECKLCGRYIYDQESATMHHYETGH